MSWVGIGVGRIGGAGAGFRDTLGHGPYVQKWKLKLGALWGRAQATQGANGQAQAVSTVPQGLTSLPPLISVTFDLQECTARPLTNKQWPRD